VAKYIGSAGNSMGFFHIEIPDVVVNHVATTKKLWSSADRGMQHNQS
jgi:hypothetical protein